VKEFKYFGYISQKNGGQEAHMRDRMARATDIETGVGDRKEKIREGLKEKDMVVRHVGQ